MREMSADYEELRRLAADYCWHVDARNVDGVVGLFTNACTFDARPIGLELMSGHEALRAFFDTVLGATQYSQHMSGNHRIDVRGDVADGSSYYLAQGAFRDGGTFFAAGYYEDVYERTDAGWRIARRVGVPLVPADVGAIRAQVD